MPPLAVLADYLELHAAERAGTPALRGPGGELAWGALPAAVRECAAGLADADVESGDVVAVFAGSRPECLVLFLACCALGAVYLGLNPRHTSRELEQVLADAAPRALFAFPRDDEEDERLRTALAALHAPPRLLGFDACARPSARMDPADPDAACALVYTSGSTGAPKGALLSQRGIIRSAQLSLERWCAVRSELRTVAQHPINHVGWLVCECVVALLRGGTVVFRERFDGAETLRVIERERLTLWVAFPSMVTLAMDSDAFARVDLAGLERLALGSAPSRTLLDRFRERSGARIAVSYGLTEASGGAVTVTDDDARDETLTRTIGKPVTGIETRIVDPSGAEVAAGEVGELLVRDACVFLGYRHLPAATAAALTDDGWLRTGDLVSTLPDGNLRLVGRLNEMFKSGGYNVYPAEVEQVVAAHEDVAAAAVVPAADPLWGEVGVAFVVPQPGRSIRADELRAHARRRLANYKVPKRFEVVGELPQLPNGKVDKEVLRTLADYEGTGTPNVS